MCEYKSLEESIIALLKSKDDDLKKKLRSAGYARPAETVRDISNLEDEIANILEEEKEQIIASLRGSESVQQFKDGQWNKEQEKDETSSKLGVLLFSVLSTNVKTYSNDYIRESAPDMSVEQVSARTQTWVEQWSSHLGDIMQDSSVSEVDRILAAGIRDNKNIPDVIQDLLDSGAMDSYYRARTTAVTEILRCHSYSQQEAFMQNPLIVAKEWRHTGGHKNNPRPHHMDMDGQTVAKEENFTLSGPNGTFYPVVPRDASLPGSESINCHCLMVAITDESRLEVPLEERQAMQEEAIEEDNAAFAAGK